VEELRKITGVATEDTKIIPGHGAQASIADVRRSLKSLDDMKNAIEQPLHAGKTLDEIRKMNVLSPWNDAFGPPCIPKTPCDHLDSEFYLTSFYQALTKAETPR